MAIFLERFKAGFQLTDDEFLEKAEIDAIKSGKVAFSLQSLEFHPTFVERVRRGLSYVFTPENMRKEEKESSIAQ